MRRYCAANGLNRLATLTYGPPRATDPAVVRAHVGDFFRDLRDGLGGEPLPYLWVPELHKDRVHFHVHFAVGRFVPVRLIRRTWGRGLVHIKLLGDLGVGSGALEEARHAAGYLSKYVGKTFADQTARVPGMHRYDLAQQFQPTKVQISGRSPEEVLARASEALGLQPARCWFSWETEGWTGPPALWAQWGR